MASYQDIETRLRTVEDKLNFAMNLIRVAQQSFLEGFPPRVVSLNDMYIESRRAGLEIVEAEEVTEPTETPNNATE